MAASVSASTASRCSCSDSISKKQCSSSEVRTDSPRNGKREIPSSFCPTGYFYKMPRFVLIKSQKIFMHYARLNGYIGERQRREVNSMTGKQLDLCICEIAAGNREALSQLYVEMKDQVFRFALSLVRSRHLAEDIEAETFLNIIQSACGYKPGTNARAWIFAIARNCCMDCMKANAKFLVVDNDSLDLLPTDANGLEQTENALLVLEAMKALSETEQMIVSLYLYSGLKQTEIAKVLNIPYLSVRSKYGYAIRKLKRYFERKGVHTDEA
ncbi:MAG TPA: hypothetical protein DHV92_03150 [Ruminococcaceae bacterium]|nr:hypothetical protein [Oscillospiraceae bacterium]